MENIRKIKITIYIDTNKRTIEKEFDTIEDAEEYLDEVTENIYGGR